MITEEELVQVAQRCRNKIVTLEGDYSARVWFFVEMLGMIHSEERALSQMMTYVEHADAVNIIDKIFKYLVKYNHGYTPTHIFKLNVSRLVQAHKTKKEVERFLFVEQNKLSVGLAFEIRKIIFSQFCVRDWVKFISDDESREQEAHLFAEMEAKKKEKRRNCNEGWMFSLCFLSMRSLIASIGKRNG
jgi:hypothetical protein